MTGLELTISLIEFDLVLKILWLTPNHTPTQP